MDFDYSDLGRIVLEAVIIVCFAMAIGLAFNYRMVMDAFSGETVSEPDRASEEPAMTYPVPVPLAEVQLMRQRAVLIDARIRELYLEGHLPDAVSFPLANFEERIGPFLENYPGDRPLIVYCSGYGCSDSFDLGVRMIENGYSNVMVYEGGFPEWRDAGLPVEEGKQ